MNIPLRFAYLCENCENIGDNPRHCLVCESTALIALATSAIGRTGASNAAETRKRVNPYADAAERRKQEAEQAPQVDHRWLGPDSLAVLLGINAVIIAGVIWIWHTLIPWLLRNGWL